MTLRLSVLMSLLALIILLLPFFAQAYPFGGQARIVLPCYYNQTIYASLGPPRGGEYIWTTATKTYLFGPPRHAGQWLLGLAGAPYYCIYKIAPLTIYTGTAITMMGSSGPTAPLAPPPQEETITFPPNLPDCSTVAPGESCRIH